MSTPPSSSAGPSATTTWLLAGAVACAGVAVGVVGLAGGVLFYRRRRSISFDRQR